jgi:flavin reductase (DIM6/NTAB) family NADH-FMN oxidoreductase RutF
VSAEPMAAAVGRIPSGLFVLTVQRGDIETGMLASWVQQCSFNPPLISLAINPKRDVAGLLTADSLFTLNILEDTQTDMIVHFGRGFPLNEPAFAELEVIRGQSNGPILAESLAFLTCQVKSRYSAGDHDLFVAQVIDGRMLDEGHPMVHVRKSGSHY